MERNPLKGLGRNDPCWCGSGRKYKRCHFGRERASPIDAWDAVKKSKKAFSKKICCAPTSMQAKCQGQIVRAHTVSRGPNLSKIARDGKVYGYAVTVPELIKSAGALKPKLIGTRQASVFNGFCKHHDVVLFSCIENEEFTGRADQCLAVAFRTLSREFYGKNAIEHIPEVIGESDKGKDLPTQVATQNAAKLIELGSTASQRELGRTQKILSDAVEKSDLGVLRSAIMYFDNPLPIMFAGAWSPATDLQGKTLQDLTDMKLVAEQIFVASFMTANGSCLCISWLEGKKKPGETIVNQLLDLPVASQSSAIFQFILKHVENIFFSPDWFEGLNAAELRQIDRLAKDGLDILGSVPAVKLDLSLDFQLPYPTRFHKV